MKLTQDEIKATVKAELDKRCYDLQRPCDSPDCATCDMNLIAAAQIANALALKYLEKYRFVRPREATASVTAEQALAGLKVKDGG